MKIIPDIIDSFKTRNKDALVYKTGVRTFRLSYLELYKKILQTTLFLEKLNIKKGDAIILWGFNSPEWVIVFLACAYKGIVIVPIDAKAMPDFVEKIHKAVKSKAIFHHAYKPPPPHIASKYVILDNLDKYIEAFEPSEKSASTAHENDLLEIVYTSGTTGDPKGVMLTQKNLVANITSVKKVVKITPDNTFLSVLPLSHLFEQNPGFLAPLSIGCTIIYMRGLRPSLIFRTLHEEKVTNIILVPRLLKLFSDGIRREFEAKGLTNLFNYLLSLDASPAIKKILFYPVHKKFGTSFQYFVSGGAPLAPELESFWRDMGFMLLQGYGLTECSPVLTVNAFENARAGSVGHALPGITLKTNKDGEVYAKGDNITAGYYKKPDETKALFDEKWMRTGDIGVIEDGYLFLKGRQKDLIVTAAGVNVYPEDIEQKLLRHSAIKDVCVLGLPTENGEEVHAEIILKNKTDLRKLVEDVNTQLNESQQITSFATWEKDDFPRTTTMKIQKRFVLVEIQNRTKSGESDLAPANQPKLYTIIAHINGIDPALVKPQANLSLDLKLTSINRVELVSMIEQEFSVDIDEEEVTTTTTVADVERMIKERKKLDEKNIFHRWLLWDTMRIIRYVYNIVLIDNLVRIFCSRTVKGMKNLKHLKQPVIFISNHTSYLDAPNIIMSLPYVVRSNIAVAAYKEYFDVPKYQIWKRLLYGFYYYHASLFTNIYLFPRVKGFKKSLEYTGELLDHDWNILFFPEGKHALDGKLQEFHTGIGWIVKEMRVPIVPIKVEGLRKILPGDTGDKIPIPKRGPATITFGKPVMPDYTKSIPEITNELQNIIARM